MLRSRLSGVVVLGSDLRDVGTRKIAWRVLLEWMVAWGGCGGCSGKGKEDVSCFVSRRDSVNYTNTAGFLTRWSSTTFVIYTDRSCIGDLFRTLTLSMLERPFNGQTDDERLTWLRCRGPARAAFGKFVTPPVKCQLSENVVGLQDEEG